MKPDGMLVEPKFLARAWRHIARRGGHNALADAGTQEPALAAYLRESLAAAVGKLALTGAPTPVVQGIHEELLTVALTCVQALRQGHYALWKDTLTGTPLARLAEEFEGPPRKGRGQSRRNKRPDVGPEEDGLVPPD
ncbi:MAG TPA: hypothetical protein VEL76_40435 [Gemmataceae bacterium]|nr:hypothetical protein [Gemmataceae bacterium]